jgi:hypothetical protein
MRLRGYVAAAVLAWMTAPVLAQTWIERPYDPPVGSRWQIVSQTDSEENRETTRRDQHVRSTGELTIVEKLPDGFRIVFINRGMTLTGNAPGTEIAQAAFGAVKDIEVRARTDRSGRPVTIENLDEVKGKMRVVVDRMVAALQSQPKVAAVMKQMLDSFLIVDGAEAARTYIEEVPLLSSAQSTGLNPGEVRREEEAVPSPFGGQIKSVVTTRLAAWDDKAGTVRYIRTRASDPEAMKAFVLTVVRKLVPAASDKISPEMMAMMKEISFDITSETTIDVEGGMAHAASQRDTMTASLMGHTMSKHETKAVTVKPLPRQ